MTVPSNLVPTEKQTPDQARAILTSTPQIAYALIALMVSIERCGRAGAPGAHLFCPNLLLFLTQMSETLAAYSANMPPPPASQMPAQGQVAPMQPASFRPPHLSQYRTPPPQTHTPPPL
ncbi:hypothetical protein BU15DRAFT_78064 [Melanogaster broomeanus]|nr:hypothetical protein BU15DRAFT_78064 [Melanogaster broomeanus]